LEFTFPNLNEVKEIATILNVPFENIISAFQQMLFDYQMPPAKIIDFLIRFATELPDQSVDMVIDLYLAKIKNGNINKQNKKFPVILHTVQIEINQIITL